MEAATPLRPPKISGHSNVAPWASRLWRAEQADAAAGAQSVNFLLTSFPSIGPRHLQLTRSPGPVPPAVCPDRLRPSIEHPSRLGLRGAGNPAVKDYRVEHCPGGGQCEQRAWTSVSPRGLFPHNFIPLCNAATCAMCVSQIIRSFPHRSHTMRRNHDGKARSGLSRASVPDGSGWSP
jgi:hypothetical protein